MVFSHKFKYVYFAIPKTASTSIIEVLIKEYDGQFWDKGDKHENLLPLTMNDYFCFASVRNPYQRGISAYNYINRKRDVPLNFCTCRDRFHLISMSRYLSLPLTIRRYATINDNANVFNLPISPDYILPRLDYTVAVESLENDFNRLPFVNKRHTLPYLNQSIKDFGNHEEIFRFVKRFIQIVKPK